MAWIMKNSAGTQVERRDELYLDDQLKGQLEKEVLPRYPSKRPAMLPVLHAVQEKHGYIPHQAMEEIGEFLEVASTDVYDTATFYEEYFFQPKGKYVIWVCQSISCELMGHQALLERLEEKLGIGVGETTDDGKVTLMHVECLGSCGTAPCALVGEKLHENLTVDNIDAILDSLE